MGGRQVSDTWERGSAYEQHVGRWGRRVAPLFLAYLNVPTGRRKIAAIHLPLVDRPEWPSCRLQG